MADERIWVRMKAGPLAGRVMNTWPEEARRYFKDGTAVPVQTDDNNVPLPESELEEASDVESVDTFEGHTEDEGFDDE